MASTAISAQLSTLTIDATPIGNFLSWQGFDGEAVEVDISNLSSTAKEKMTGLQDSGSFSCEIHTDPSDAGQAALIAAQAASSESAFVLTLKDGTTYTFNASVKNATSLSGGVDQPVAGSVSLAVSGEPVIVPG
jgi:hypothetical protein